MDERNPLESAVQNPQKQAQLILTYDLETLVLSISGTVPNFVVALDMCRRACDECTYLIAQERAKAAGPRVAPADWVTPHLMGRG